MSRLTDEVITVRCPFCGVEGVGPCQTKAGYDCPDHVARKKAHEALRTLSGGKK